MIFPFVSRRKFESLSLSLKETVGDLDAATQGLTNEIHEHERLKHDHAALRVTLEIEQAHRISSDAIAVERAAEVNRLIEQNRELRDDAMKANAERLRSLDAINLKLMEPHIAEPAPDLTKYRAVEKMKDQLVSNIRAQHHAVDMAVLQKLHPKFAPRPVNAPMPVIEIPEEVA